MNVNTGQWLRSAHIQDSTTPHHTRVGCCCCIQRPRALAARCNTCDTMQPHKPPRSPSCSQGAGCGVHKSRTERRLITHVCAVTVLFQLSGAFCAQSADMRHHADRYPLGHLLIVVPICPAHVHVVVKQARPPGCCGLLVTPGKRDGGLWGSNDRGQKRPSSHLERRMEECSGETGEAIRLLQAAGDTWKEGHMYVVVKSVRGHQVVAGCCWHLQRGT